MSLLIAGTVAYDSIKSPFGEHAKVLGGSGMHAAMAATVLSPVRLVSVIGEDFEKKYLDLFAQKNIDTKGIQVVKGGKTFFWSGFYEKDMNQAHSLQTDLNVLLDFKGDVPAAYTDSTYVFVGNIEPNLQAKIVDQVTGAKVVAMDTMNFWISSQKEAVLNMVKKATILFINDAEIRDLTGEVNLLKAARQLIATGCSYVVVKKGEHGAMLVSAKDVFVAPAFPLDLVKDPTGAGDTFAGSFMSYIVKHNDYSFAAMKQAVVYGTVMASFNVEDFSCFRVEHITRGEIEQRLVEYAEKTNSILPVI